jgi:hypothetical protein
MDVIERGFTSLRKASRYWKIPLRSLSNHLTSKIASKKRGPLGILLIDEEVTVVESIFGMQECSLSISLH